CLQYASYPLTF
nr:immunoglobulin light chain junction region [Mus musculus]NSM02252.1 immunoglobulin light chain junction region [Mus musculus]